MNFRIERLGTGLIIAPDMDARMGTNINGPSLIRAPDWLTNPLGRYYLYFAHHNGSYIRLAVADAAEGPWRTHEDGVLDLAGSYFIDHIASPEIYIDSAAKSIWLYFHGRTGYKPDGGQVQGTRVAKSSDGLTFTVRKPLLGPAYFRVFRQDGAFYAFAQTAELLRSPDGFQPFESLGIPNGFPEDIRHVALWRRNETEMTNFSHGDRRVTRSDLRLHIPHGWRPLRLAGRCFHRDHASRIRLRRRRATADPVRTRRYRHPRQSAPRPRYLCR
jgi:hypothetical protein